MLNEPLIASENRMPRARLNPEPGCSQIYPENAAQAQLLTSSAMRAGFTGGLVVDYPHSTRAKKCDRAPCTNPL